MRTPAVVGDDEGANATKAVFLSAAAAALLDPEERERLVSLGTARVSDDAEAPETPVYLQRPPTARLWAARRR